MAPPASHSTATVPNHESATPANMINRIRARFERPEKGWDPIDPEYAARYAAGEWAKGANPALLDEFDLWMGGLEGKTILDLGGGPGQYAVGFAKRGAIVTWHDVSHEYLAIAEAKARQHDVDLKFSLGYMDEAPEILDRQFDLVFNRICWYYGHSDPEFADVVYELVRPGGYAYIDTNHAEGRLQAMSRLGRARSSLNAYFAIKIGHPYPPHGRIESLFRRYAGRVRVDRRAPQSDRIWFEKAGLA